MGLDQTVGVFYAQPPLCIGSNLRRFISGLREQKKDYIHNLERNIYVTFIHKDLIPLLL